MNVRKGENEQIKKKRKYPTMLKNEKKKKTVRNNINNKSKSIFCDTYFAMLFKIT